MNLTGTIKLVNETQQISEKFKKREFVLTTNEDTDYPQDILIQTIQDKTALLDGLNPGDVIIAEINIRGREWINPEGQAKYFNSIEAWKITNDF